MWAFQRYGTLALSLCVRHELYRGPVASIVEDVDASRSRNSNKLGSVLRGQRWAN